MSRLAIDGEMLYTEYGLLLSSLRTILSGLVVTGASTPVLLLLEASPDSSLLEDGPTTLRSSLSPISRPLVLVRALATFLVDMKSYFLSF